MRSAILFVALCSVAQAQGPTPKIDGPSAARVGDIIILDASESVGDHFNWYVDSSGIQFPTDGSGISKKVVEQLIKLGWTPPSRAGRVEYMMLDGGKKLILASYPGTWKVVLAVSNKDGVKQLPHTLGVTGGGGNPPPGPGPGPGPQPPDPIKTDFTAEAKLWLATVPRKSREKKDSRGNSVQKNVRETMHEIGSRHAQLGSITAMKRVLQAGFLASLRVLGRDAKDWQTFVEKTNAALDSVENAGGTAAQYGAALVSIAKGME